MAKAVNRGEGEIKSLSKLAEGGFNRTFEVTMKDGLQIIARLPYPSTPPKRYAVASEVATMDLVRTYGLPVPRIYGYAVTADNSVGSEYIIMEKVQGKEIGHFDRDQIWFRKQVYKDRVLVASMLLVELAYGTAEALGNCSQLMEDNQHRVIDNSLLTNY